MKTMPFTGASRMRRSRMLCVAALASLAASSPVLAQSVTCASSAGTPGFSYGGIRVAAAGSATTLSMTTTIAGVTTMRFALLGAQGGDSIANYGVSPITAGATSQTVQLGPGAGLRAVRFCADDGITQCDPLSSPVYGVIHIPAVASNCGLTPSTQTISAGQGADFTAACAFDGGSGIALTSASYGWSLPAGTPLPFATPPADATAHLAPAAAGTYPLSITPSFDYQFNRFAGGYSDLCTVSGVAGANGFASLVVQALQPPTVTLDAPADGATLPLGQPTTLRASASDSDGVVAQVWFRVDDVVVGSDTSAPYQLTWTPTVRGHHLIRAVAVDDTSLETTSAAADVEVTDPRAPSVRITAPQAQQIFERGDAIEIRAEASDTDGRVTRVRFVADGETLGESSSAPYTHAWNNAPVGNHDLVAIAFDDSGLSTQSRAVPLQVRAVVDRLELATPSAALKVTPNAPAHFDLRALRDDEGVAGQRLDWEITNGDVRPGGTPAGPACGPGDAPTRGQVTTGADGAATIAFNAGCASGGREINVQVVDSPGISARITLAGPDQDANTLAPVINAQIIVVRPDQPADVQVNVTNAGGAPLAGATLVFALQPADAGSIDASATTDGNGRASAALSLAAASVDASVSVCVRDRPTLCVDLPVVNFTQAVKQPALTLVTPITQTALDSARTQLRHAGSRMNQLRSDGGHGFSSHVNLRAGEAAISTSEEDSSDGSDAGKDERNDGRAGVFVLGDIEFGKRDASGGVRGFDLTTRGLTVGADYRFTPNTVAGLAIGAMRGDTDLGNGGEQSSSGWSVAAFGQWLPTERWYVNAALSTGRNGYDSHRRARDDTVLRSSTSSAQTGIQLESGYSFAVERFKFTPYARYEWINADIDGFAEQDHAEAIAISDQAVRSKVLAVGALGEWVFGSRHGVWIPSLRVEFLSESQDTDGLSARLLNGNLTFLPLDAQEVAARYGNLGFNLIWLTSVRGQPISTFIGIDSSFGRGAYSDQRIMFGIKVPL